MSALTNWWQMRIRLTRLSTQNFEVLLTLDALSRKVSKSDAFSILNKASLNMSSLTTMHSALKFMGNFLPVVNIFYSRKHHLENLFEIYCSPSNTSNKTHQEIHLAQTWHKYWNISGYTHLMSTSMLYSCLSEVNTVYSSPISSVSSWASTIPITIVVGPVVATNLCCSSSRAAPVQSTLGCQVGLFIL